VLHGSFSYLVAEVIIKVVVAAKEMGKMAGNMVFKQVKGTKINSAVGSLIL
jgi:hypothetical protein